MRAERVIEPVQAAPNTDPCDGKKNQIKVPKIVKRNGFRDRRKTKWFKTNDLNSKFLKRKNLGTLP
jgi:hypothetical protein